MRYSEVAFRNLEEKAIAFAEKKHAGQTYSNNKPYVWHLKKAADNGKKWIAHLTYGNSVEIVIIALWLHDVIEDTAATYEEVLHEFGEEVANIVRAVTNQEGKNRLEKATRTLPVIRAAGSAAVYVKLMDRLANIEAGSKNSMYLKEHSLFKSILYKEGEFEAIWKYMETILAENE